MFDPSKPLTAEQIAHVKAKMREDPDVKRLVKRLGITMDRFLADIEKQAESCELYDATDDAEKARTEREIQEAAEEAYAEAREEVEVKSGSRDGIIDDAEADHAVVSRKAVGVKKPTDAPKEQGTGEVIVASEKLDARGIKKQITGGKLDRERLLAEQRAAAAAKAKEKAAAGGKNDKD